MVFFLSRSFLLSGNLSESTVTILYELTKVRDKKSFMQGHWTIFILYKENEGKRYIYIRKWRTDKIFRLFGKIVYTKNSRQPVS